MVIAHVLVRTLIAVHSTLQADTSAPAPAAEARRESLLANWSAVDPRDD